MFKDKIYSIFEWTPTSPTRSRFGGGFELTIGSAVRRRHPTNGNGTSRERRRQVRRTLFRESC